MEDEHRKTLIFSSYIIDYQSITTVAFQMCNHFPIHAVIVSNRQEHTLRDPMQII